MPPIPTAAENFLQLLAQGSPGTLVTSLTGRVHFGKPSPELKGDEEEEEPKRRVEEPTMRSDFDPFSCDIKLEPIDYVQLIIGSVLLLPVRAVGVVTLLLSAWTVATIGLVGLTTEEAQSMVVGRKGWRKKLMTFYSYFGYLILLAAGFRVTIKGKQVSRKEAPILIGAPHSTFLEALVMTMCSCSPVAREEGRNAIVISACQLFFQTLFIDRRTPEGRQKAKDAICLRSLAPDNGLPQLFICPEGTNTNRKALIQFKVGAFNPGVPVQPVMIRYPGYERLDAITWTYRQNHTYLYSLWYILTRPVNRVEVEFLPVCAPSLEEQLDPALFAKNVQLVMARALDIPATDMTFTEYYNEYCTKKKLTPTPRDQKKVD